MTFKEKKILSTNNFTIQTTTKFIKTSSEVTPYLIRDCYDHTCGRLCFSLNEAERKFVRSKFDVLTICCFVVFLSFFFGSLVGSLMEVFSMVTKNY